VNKQLAAWLQVRGITHCGWSVAVAPSSCRPSLPVKAALIMVTSSSQGLASQPSLEDVGKLESSPAGSSHVILCHMLPLPHPVLLFPATFQLLNILGCLACTTCHLSDMPDGLLLPLLPQPPHLLPGTMIWPCPAALTGILLPGAACCCH